MIDPIVAIVGSSNSGKTTLIEKLVNHFNQANCNVSVIKHTHHDFEMDQDEKDTFKIKKAGAGSVAITNDQKLAIISDLQVSVSPMELARNFLKFGSDFVLVEGFKDHDIPKIEVCDKQWENSLTHKGMDNVVALITDSYVDEEEIDLPVFKRNDIESVVEFLEMEFMVQPTKK